MKCILIMKLCLLVEMDPNMMFQSFFGGGGSAFNFHGGSSGGGGYPGGVQFQFG